MPDEPINPEEKPPIYTEDLIREALEKQAAMRPPKAPAKLMPITPTLPRQPKPARARKRAQGKRW